MTYVVAGLLLRDWGMANRPAPALMLRSGDREELERWTRASTLPASAARRARIVLLAAEGTANTRIAELVDATVTTVLSWRNRYQDRGMAGLADARRSGRPRSLDQRAIVAETLIPPPRRLGVTHWSSRLLADRLGTSNTSIARIWRAYGIKPWRAQSFRFSTNPELIGVVTDICGLFLAPPDNAIVLRVDEKPQVQAIKRTGSMTKQDGRIEAPRSHGDRHATLILTAALGGATGQVTAALKPLHRNKELLAFLKQVERAYCDVVDEENREPVALHLVIDSHAALKHRNVKDWLARNPRVVVHSTPTHASWMNLVEIWSAIVEHRTIRRGGIESVDRLSTNIRAFVEVWNDRSQPFVWTNTAD